MADFDYAGCEGGTLRDIGYNPQRKSLRHHVEALLQGLRGANWIISFQENMEEDL